MKPDSSHWYPETGQAGHSWNNHKKNPFEYKKKLFCGVFKHWIRLPRKAVYSPSMEILKSWVDTALSNLLQLPLLWSGVGLDVLQRCPPALAGLWLWSRELLSMWLVSAVLEILSSEGLPGNQFSGLCFEVRHLNLHWLSWLQLWPVAFRGRATSPMC